MNIDDNLPERLIKHFAEDDTLAVAACGSRTGIITKGQRFAAPSPYKCPACIVISERTLERLQSVMDRVMGRTNNEIR